MRKIFFNDRYGLTQAVLDGRKTMTRRIIKSDYDNIAVLPLLPNDSCFVGYNGNIIGSSAAELHPLYWVGEIVAVAQRYSQIITFNPSALSKERLNYYGVGVEDCKYLRGWNNKMFVKASLMPYRIRITDIKFERLQDISEEDCMREGIRESIVEFGEKKIVQWTYFHEKRTIWFDSPREAFAALIDRISGKGTWERNPWVFAYEFELIK